MAFGGKLPGIGVLLLSCCLACCLAFPATAQSDKSTGGKVKIDIDNNFTMLSGMELLEIFKEGTFSGVYGESSGRVMEDGTPETFEEKHAPNATTQYDHRGVDVFKTPGVYQIQKDHICYTYNKPEIFEGTSCFYVYEKTDCYFHYFLDDGKPEAKEDFEDWTYKANDINKSNACLPEVA